VPEATPGRVAESRATVVRLMVPTDANFMGNVFGGVILAEVDRVAYITARRHAGAECVTASFDRVDFLAPLHVGDVVTFNSVLTYVGRTSMEVSVTVEAERIESAARRSVGQAYVTLVAVGGDGRPVPVRALAVKAGEETRRFEEGRARMEARRVSRKTTPKPRES
jgi:acyl-CoA hydrolase